MTEIEIYASYGISRKSTILHNGVFDVENVILNTKISLNSNTISLAFLFWFRR